MKSDKLEKALELKNEINRYKQKKESATKINFKGLEADADAYIAIKGYYFDAEAHLPQQDVRDLLKVYVFFISKKIKKLELELKLLGVDND